MGALVGPEAVGLGLDRFWVNDSRQPQGTLWDQVLFVLVAYRLIAPGAEWRCIGRVRAQRLGGLAGSGRCVADSHKPPLPRPLLAHKQAVFDHLRSAGGICSSPTCAYDLPAPEAEPLFLTTTSVAATRAIIGRTVQVVIALW
jgi:hypothetical protein